MILNKKKDKRNMEKAFFIWKVKIKKRTILLNRPGSGVRDLIPIAIGTRPSAQADAQRE